DIGVKVFKSLPAMTDHRRAKCAECFLAHLHRPGDVQLDVSRSHTSLYATKRRKKTRKGFLVHHGFSGKRRPGWGYPLPKGAGPVRPVRTRKEPVRIECQGPSESLIYIPRAVRKALAAGSPKFREEPDFFREVSARSPRASAV